MGLLKDWREHAYGLDDRTPEGKQFWLNYFGVEKGIYEQLLADPDQVITCTVKELAEKYDTTIELITGFLDGIDDSLVKSNDLLRAVVFTQILNQKAAGCEDVILPNVDKPASSPDILG